MEIDKNNKIIDLINIEITTHSHNEPCQPTAQTVVAIHSGYEEPRSKAVQVVGVMELEWGAASAYSTMPIPYWLSLASSPHAFPLAFYQISFLPFFLSLVL